MLNLIGCRTCGVRAWVLISSSTSRFARRSCATSSHRYRREFPLTHSASLVMTSALPGAMLLIAGGALAIRHAPVWNRLHAATRWIAASRPLASTSLASNSHNVSLSPCAISTFSYFRRAACPRMRSNNSPPGTSRTTAQRPIASLKRSPRRLRGRVATSPLVTSRIYLLARKSIAIETDMRSLQRLIISRLKCGEEAVLVEGEVLRESDCDDVLLWIDLAVSRCRAVPAELADR